MFTRRHPSFSPGVDVFCYVNLYKCKGKMFKTMQIGLKFFETLTIKPGQNLNAHWWILLLEVRGMEVKCVRDNEVVSAIENFEIMLTQLINRLGRKIRQNKKLKA